MAVTGTKVEKDFAERMINRGWKVYRNGFPDFLCIKNRQVILVEVKQGKNDKLKAHQKERITQLLNHPLEAFVWVADTGEFLSISGKTASIKMPKITSIAEKARRNAAIIAYASANPELTIRQIAQAFGLSFQRIHQILKKSQ